MDIDILLALQEFRFLINDALTPFMEMISLFAVTYLVIVPALVYWCVDKRSGLYTLASYSLSVAVNAVVKLTACVYRPWIRDSRIVPAGDAITTATGYSFPSGHSSTAAPIYGSLAVSSKKISWISWLCLFCVLITGFSRLYLGVHTPQDVLVGLLIGFLTVFFMGKLFKYFEDHPEKEDLFLGIGAACGIVAIAYITFKSYPMDYVGDQLLVDPYRMKKDGYGDIGMFISYCVSRFAEKHWVKYEPTGSKANLAVALTGGVLLFFLIETLSKPLRALLGLHWGTLATEFIIYFFIIVIWPAVMKQAVTNKENTEEIDVMEDLK